MSLLGFRALGDLNRLVQQQLSVLTGEAEDEWTLVHRDPAGSLLPEGEDTHKEGWVILVIVFLKDYIQVP